MVHLFTALAHDGILIAIIAHSLIGVSLVWDKALLQRRGTENLPSYVFWLGAMSIFGVIIAAFGFHLPSVRIAAISFLAGFLDLLATVFYYWALKTGEASQELSMVGGFAPVATALISVPILHQVVGGNVLGFTLMTVGGFMMFFAEARIFTRALPKVLAASGIFGLSNVLQKLVFNSTTFVNGYVFFCLGTAVTAFSMLLVPSWRRQIIDNSSGAETKNKAGYMVNRVIAGVGSFLVVYAISKANAAVVVSIAGVRYVVIFIGAYAVTRWRPNWFRENFKTFTLIAKAVATALVVAGLVLVGLSGGVGAPA